MNNILNALNSLPLGQDCTARDSVVKGHAPTLSTDSWSTSPSQRRQARSPLPFFDETWIVACLPTVPSPSLSPFLPCLLFLLFFGYCHAVSSVHSDLSHVSVSPLLLSVAFATMASRALAATPLTAAASAPGTSLDQIEEVIEELAESPEVSCC